MKINCIVVEDEPLALERTVSYIKKVPALHLAATFDNALDAFSFLQSNTPGIIFLDINLGEMSGIQLLESIRIKSNVIITTAYPDFALKGYDLNVTDYLLKPFSFERFLQAVDKVQLSITNTELPSAKNFVFIKTESRLEKIFFADILFIEGMRDYRRIHTLQKKIMTLQTFGELEKEIPPAIICRVHKSYMVAIDKIDAVEKDRIHIQKMVIPVSDTYKQLFFQIIGR
ncbi:LytR/AlgR family response regulator transcription factor [Ferruginibacter sp. SUN106]|uniref:LytR/AlgR family response regulator transcription factor n=1 Tax=Ferruginibacter sp. SUN106 TaxID=2978348 RepID=UPI003D366C60